MTKSPANSGKPALLVDIDGVISLWGFASDARPEGTWLTVDGIVHFLSAAAARNLLVLSDHFELAWCSGWEEKANEYLPRALGLPRSLPFLTLDWEAREEKPTVPHDAGGPRHWKLAAIDPWAGPERPLAWIDDDHDQRCREWARQRPGPTLLVTTDPATGLTDREAGRLVEWATGLG